MRKKRDIVKEEPKSLGPNQPTNGGSVKLTDGEKNALSRLLADIRLGKEQHFDLLDRAKATMDAVGKLQEEFKLIVQRKLELEGVTGSNVAFDLDAGFLTVSPAQAK
jgi:hypothetical protein